MGLIGEWGVLNGAYKSEHGCRNDDEGFCYRAAYLTTWSRRLVVVVVAEVVVVVCALGVVLNSAHCQLMNGESLGKDMNGEGPLFLQQITSRSPMLSSLQYNLPSCHSFSIISFLT